MNSSNIKMNETCSNIPILTPKPKLLNLWLVQFHSFVAFISRVSIPQSHSVINMQSFVISIHPFHNLIQKQTKDLTQEPALEKIPSS